ncbi:MAG: hypothetical protein ACE141_03315 [Bryobacteraceae bacterium]
MRERECRAEIFALMLAVIGFAALRATAAEALPPYCGVAGAQRYLAPSVTIPAPALDRGTFITVTSTSDELNGDSSSVRALLARPGPDGISLREAVEATNHDRGVWQISFSPALKGATLRNRGLWLIGGDLTINGDVDGDGQPDVTLASVESGDDAFYIVSGDNTLHALALQGYSTGVQIVRPSSRFGLPPATNTTFPNITVSNTVMTAIKGAGVLVFPVVGEMATSLGSPALTTRNTWDHISIVGNSISGPERAIEVTLTSTSGDRLQHTIIANNTLRPAAGGRGVSFGGIGVGLGSRDNTAVDTLIANNTIEVVRPEAAIRIAGGEMGAQWNLIDGLRVIGNTIRISPPAVEQVHPTGLSVMAGDAATDFQIPDLKPIQYADNNVIRNLEILGNRFEGPASQAIQIATACCGNRGNVIDNLSIMGNVIAGAQYFGVLLVGGNSGDYYSRTTAGNQISKVQIQANSIQVAPAFPRWPDYLVTTGGIQVWGGFEEPENTISDVSIAYNDVDTPLLGIGIVGGWGETRSAGDHNVVSAAEIFCNRLRSPPATVAARYPGVKGVHATGGLLNAKGNRVERLRVEDNLVAGALGEASFWADVGGGASGNIIEISRASPASSGPQIDSGGVVSSAHFRQRAVAPGSLVSLFGRYLSATAVGAYHAPLPLELSGTTVRFDGIAAPLLFVSPTQVNLQVPWELAGRPQSVVTVTVKSVAGPPATVSLAQADTGVFAINMPEGGQGAVVDMNGRLVDERFAAGAGDWVQIYCTGLGPVTNTPASGEAGRDSPLSETALKPTVLVGGTPAAVTYSGLAPGFVGLYQVNARIPAGLAPGPKLPLLVVQNGVLSNEVTLAVK